MADQQKILLDDWVIRSRVPEGKGPFPVFLMLHGWTGDEEAMWIFAPRLPKYAVLIAPRGLYEASPGGFSWYRDEARGWPRVEDFSEVVDRLLELLNPAVFPQANFDALHLVGFSQGAAAAYAFTLMVPERVSSVSGLAGFMPVGASIYVSVKRLKGLPAFVTHGTRDELVPVERGREAARMLEEAGALVTYCEDDVGHKLSATCFRGLENFYRNEMKGCEG
jgi:phospholipase/carboxylesterase